MDADDELFPKDQENLKNLLKQQLDENAVYFFETVNYYGNVVDDNSVTINLNPRLFKNNQGTHYAGEVHNQLVRPKNKYAKIYNLIKIHHYGYMDKIIKSKDKKNRTITLLKNQIKNDPNNYFAYFNLGTEYATLNDFKTGLHYLYKSYEDFDPYRGYSFLLILRIVILNYKIKDYNNSLKFIDIGIKHYPKFTDLYFVKSLIYKDTNKPTLQIEALKKCIELGEAPSQLKCYYGTGSFKAYYELGDVYLNLKDYDTAYKCYIEAMKIKPDFISPLYQVAYILKISNTSSKDFEKIITGFFDDLSKANSILINLFYCEDYYKLALDYIEKYEQNNTITGDLTLLKSKCLLMTDGFDKCLNINNLSKDSPEYLRFSMYKVLSSILTNDYKKALSILNDFKQDTLSKSDEKLFKVYSQLTNLFTQKPTSNISEKENEKDYLNIILEILEILLINNKFAEFKTAINLLNLINNNFMLLSLGKLYHKYGYNEFAKHEIIRSIKTFEVYDKEGLEILMEQI